MSHVPVKMFVFVWKSLPCFNVMLVWVVSSLPWIKCLDVVATGLGVWVGWTLIPNTVFVVSLQINQHVRGHLAIPENREFQKWKLSFFRQGHILSTSFDIFVITYRVTDFLPKLINMLLFSTKKTEFPFLLFPYFRVMPGHLPDSSLKWHKLCEVKASVIVRIEFVFCLSSVNVNRHMWSFF